MHTKLTTVTKTSCNASVFAIIVVFATIVMSPSVTSVWSPY